MAITLPPENDSALFPLSVKSLARSVWCAESDVCQCEFIEGECGPVALCPGGCIQRSNKLTRDRLVKFFRNRTGQRMMRKVYRLRVSLLNIDWQPWLEISDFISLLTTRNLPHWLFSTDCNSSIFFNCVHFYLGPTGPAAVVVVVIRLRWQGEGAGEWRPATPSWCVRLITQPSDPEVTSSTESVTFHGRCKSIRLCQTSTSSLAFPELAYWSAGNAWVRTSRFPLLKMAIVSPADSSVKVYCRGP